MSGVRQCPGRDLILSLLLIYCARHAPHRPTGVQSFCPTSLIFCCSQWCGPVAAPTAQDLLKENVFDQSSREWLNNQVSPGFLWLIILHTSKICSKKTNVNKLDPHSQNDFCDKLFHILQNNLQSHFSQAAPLLPVIRATTNWNWLKQFEKNNWSHCCYSCLTTIQLSIEGGAIFLVNSRQWEKSQASNQNFQDHHHCTAFWFNQIAGLGFLTLHERLKAY